MKSILKEFPHEFLKNTTPICYLESGMLLCYKNGGFIEISNEDTIIYKEPVFTSFTDRILSRFNLLNRLLRLGPRSGIAIDEHNVLISKSSYIFEYDTTTNQLSKGFFCGKRTRPLTFSQIRNVKGFKDGIYYGDYLMNMDKSPVSVYYRTGVDKWEVIYTFPEGTINHIHNIVADPFRNCLWIFTGDFDEASAIWRVSDGFNVVERVVFNQQQYRACVAHVLPEGILYATDTPFTDNYVYLLNADTKEIKKITSIHGSCIYGCKWGDSYVFSSTVEGDEVSDSLLKTLLSRKKGSGIVDEYVHLYRGDLDIGFKEIYKEKKDLLPFFLFQFGAFKFPLGPNNGKYLYFQSIATNKNDLSLIRYSD